MSKLKKPEEYLDEFDFFEENNECGVFTYLVDNAEKRDLAKIIFQAQKDAYNQAIDDAVKNAKTTATELNDETWEVFVDPKSIFKLKIE